MTAVLEAPPIERRCQIEEVFTTSFIELLRMAPRNAIIRGLVLSLTRKMPPEACHTYDQMKEWVEFNCDKRSRRVGGTGDGVAMTVQFEDREFGRASYSVTRYGSETFHIEAGDIEDAAREAVEDGQRLDALVSTLASRIKEDAWEQCSPCMDDYGDYDYAEHDQEDAENREIEFSKPELRQRVIAFLQEHHPDLLEELT